MVHIGVVAAAADEEGRGSVDEERAVTVVDDALPDEEGGAMPPTRGAYPGSNIIEVVVAAPAGLRPENDGNGPAPIDEGDVERSAVEDADDIEGRIPPRLVHGIAPEVSLLSTAAAEDKDEGRAVVGDGALEEDENEPSELNRDDRPPSRLVEADDEGEEREKESKPSIVERRPAAVDTDD